MNILFTTDTCCSLLLTKIATEKVDDFLCQQQAPSNETATAVDVGKDNTVSDAEPAPQSNNMKNMQELFQDISKLQKDFDDFLEEKKGSTDQGKIQWYKIHLQGLENWN